MHFWTNYSITPNSREFFKNRKSKRNFFPEGHFEKAIAGIERVCGGKAVDRPIDDPLVVEARLDQCQRDDELRYA